MSNQEKDYLINYCKDLEEENKRLEERNALLKKDNECLKWINNKRTTEIQELQKSAKIQREVRTTRKNRKLPAHSYTNCNFQPAHLKVLNFFKENKDKAFYSKEVELQISGITASPRMSELYRGLFLEFAYQRGSKIYYKYNSNGPIAGNTIEFQRNRR